MPDSKAVAATVDTELPPYPVIDPAIVSQTLSAPPFVTIEGVPNVRDFGAGYTSVLPSAADFKFHSESLSTGRTYIKPLHLFRSGEPTRISSRGVEQLRALGVSKVFDLRADFEITEYKTATPVIEGVEVVRAPIIVETMGHLEIADRLKEFGENEVEAFVKVYTVILKAAGPTLEKILVHMRDSPDEPWLMHCTAGKDRTGVLAAVILMLLGAEDKVITADYALTTIGMQPLFPLLAARFKNEKAWVENPQGALNLGSSKVECMQAVLNAIRRDYGGAATYVKHYTSLTDEDIARVRKNLLVHVE
ncbi:protein-tyrosine phosphatase-like protein [Daedaleopsis nitida]|nr:protein-tyrosine phosphatase-like protein [Daedaleopsis nitida]